MHTVVAKMTDTFRGAIARVFKTGDSKGIKHRKHAMLWLFQVFVLTAGLYGCQIRHFFSNLSFLKNYFCTRPSSWLSETNIGCQKKHWYTQLATRDGTDAYRLLLVQVHHTILEQPTRLRVVLSSNNPLLEKVVRADLLLASRSDTWTYQVLDALGDVPDSQHLLDVVRFRQPINVKEFELTLREHIIRNWRDLDNLTPYEAHHSSRIMRTHHTHFGVPLGNTPGW